MSVAQTTSSTTLERPSRARRSRPRQKSVRFHKVTSADLDDYVTRVVTAFLDDRVEDETFAAWVARADEVHLRGERELEAV